MDVTWPLVGRRAEVEVLSAVLADTPAGGVVLAGEAGVGKTRLARGALARAGAGGGRHPGRPLRSRSGSSPTCCPRPGASVTIASKSSAGPPSCSPSGLVGG